MTLEKQRDELLERAALEKYPVVYTYTGDLRFDMNYPNRQFWKKRYIEGFDAAVALMQEREAKLVEALKSVKPALSIALEDTADLYYANVEADIDRVLAAINPSAEEK